MSSSATPRTSTARSAIDYSRCQCLYSSGQSHPRASETTVMSFTRMDQGKVEVWLTIVQAVARRQAAMAQIIKAMLAQLEAQVDVFEVILLVLRLMKRTNGVRTHAG